MAMNQTLMPSARVISPWLEMGAYEALWARSDTTFKRIAEKFCSRPDAVPSDFVSPSIARKTAEEVKKLLDKYKVERFGVRVHGAGEYPAKLREAQYPIEFLYYQGWWDLAESPSVAVVGTRKPTPEGKARAAKLVRHLVKDKFTIVSGLAKGIDTVAHETAIHHNGLTIGVIGTPISAIYPRENQELQKRIAKDYLLISQVPVIRYSKQNYRRNRLFFPERNITMSALTLGTIIVEAGETSGTLAQARAAIYQKRQLFILDNCFQNRMLTWPAKFETQGAIRVRNYEDIRRHLAPPIKQDR